MKFKLQYNKEENRLYVNKNAVVLIVIVILILIPFITVTLLIQTKSLRLTTPELQTTPLGFLPDTLKNVQTDNVEVLTKQVVKRLEKDYGNKLTIIFFYDGYENQSKALADIEVMKQAILGVEPFKSIPDLLAFKIFTTEGNPCSIEMINTKKRLICDKRLLQGIANLGIDHIKIVVVSPEEFSSSSELARGKDSVITISTNQGKLSSSDLKRWMGILVTQELGHSLGLRYEYITEKPSKYEDGDRLGFPNCVESMQDAFKIWKNYTAAFPEVKPHAGCAGDDFSYYPESHTLMSDDPKKEGYGRVSEDYLRGILSCFYGEKESIIFPNGYGASYDPNLKNCTVFKTQFPNFWKE